MQIFGALPSQRLAVRMFYQAQVTTQIVSLLLQSGKEGLTKIVEAIRTIRNGELFINAKKLLFTVIEKNYFPKINMAVHSQEIFLNGSKRFAGTERRTKC